MKNQDQQVTATVRSITQHLKADHGIEVAHSAMRSSYLKACGKNPQAFRNHKSSSTLDLKSIAPAAPVPASLCNGGLLLVPRAIPQDMLVSLLPKRLRLACSVADSQAFGHLEDFVYEVLKESIARVEHDEAAGVLKPLKEMSSSVIDSMLPPVYPAYYSEVTEDMRELALAVQAKVHTLIPVPVAKAPPPVDVRTLYLASDEVGCLTRLSLDQSGHFLIPEDFDFKGATLFLQKAAFPQESIYSNPEYLTNPYQFFGECNSSIKLSAGFRQEISECKDDSDNKCELQLVIPAAIWECMVLATIQEAGCWESIEAYVEAGLNLSLGTLPASEQVVHMVTYVDNISEFMIHDVRKTSLVPPLSHGRIADVTFDWVYPDEDGDSVDGKVDLDTGVVVLNRDVPEDVRDRKVRTRIQLVNPDISEELLTVCYAGKGLWEICDEDREELRSLTLPS